METQALRWFQQVADGYTVTEVAELEMVSQPGVSRALARLEEEVGAPLLQRRGRHLRPTQAGVAFKRHVDAMMHSLDDGLAAVQQLIDPETGVVTLAFQASLGAWLVPSLVGSFGHRHPGVRFDLRTKADETDLAVGPGSPVDVELSTLPPPVHDYEWRTVTTEPLGLLVPARNPLADRATLDLADAADQPFIGIRRTSLLHNETAAICERAGFSPRIDLVADDLPTLRAYVAAGLGVGVVPARRVAAAETVTPRVRYLPLTDTEAHRTVRMIWCTARRTLPAAQLFRRHVEGRIQRDKIPGVQD